MAYSTNTSQVLEHICTDSRLAQLMDFALTGMDKGIHRGMILIDLCKVFDTRDYKILLEKMSCLDFRTPVIK